MHNWKEVGQKLGSLRAIKIWIEYYNTKRIQMKLGGLSPIEYQQQAA